VKVSFTGVSCRSIFIFEYVSFAGLFSVWIGFLTYSSYHRCESFVYRGFLQVYFHIWIRLFCRSLFCVNRIFFTFAVCHERLTVCCSVLQCVAVCWGVLQYVAVCHERLTHLCQHRCVSLFCKSLFMYEYVSFDIFTCRKCVSLFCRSLLQVSLYLKRSLLAYATYILQVSFHFWIGLYWHTAHTAAVGAWARTQVRYEWEVKSEKWKVKSETLSQVRHSHKWDTLEWDWRVSLCVEWDPRERQRERRHSTLQSHSRVSHLWECLTWRVSSFSLCRVRPTGEREKLEVRHSQKRDTLEWDSRVPLLSKRPALSHKRDTLEWDSRVPLL